MATKKQNKRLVVRQVRRALNNSADFFINKISGRRLNHYGWGTGVSQGIMKEKDEKCD